MQNTCVFTQCLLAGVEDIDNTTLSERPKMFDSVARPYVIAFGDIFAALDSCGVGGPNAQTAEAEKILSCNPDIVISEYEYEIALINTWFIAKTVYPELSTDIDITEKTNEVTSVFLGSEFANEIFAYPSSFGGYQKIDTSTFFG